MTERVLFVCTGNQCRSPMAEALLRAKLPSGSGIEVDSVGTVGDGTPPPEHAVRVMAERGLDIEGRPSRLMDAAVLEGADLVVVMGRQHLVEVGATAGSALDRSFTVTDLLDRAAQAGGRGGQETLAQWARRMSAGRVPASILSLSSAGDIPDPMGRPLREFETCAAILDRATTALAGYVLPDALGPGDGSAHSVGSPAGEDPAGSAEGAPMGAGLSRPAESSGVGSRLRRALRRR